MLSVIRHMLGLMCCAWCHLLCFTCFLSLVVAHVTTSRAVGPVVCATLSRSRGLCHVV